MTSQTAGIQQLLAAEKKAAEKIKEARQRKAKQLKKAKDEAQQEIDRYKSEREAQFKAFEKQHLGSREDVLAKIENETRTDLQRMKGSVEQNKDKVIGELLQLVCDVRPELHTNYSPDRPGGS